MSSLGRFAILHEVARGGMGVVHEAEDPTLRRRVALKVLRDDPDLLPRVHRGRARRATAPPQTRGAVRHRRGERRGALDDFTAALAVDPRALAPLRNRAIVLDELADVTGAADDLIRALEFAPPDWVARAEVTRHLAAVRSKMRERP